MSKNNLLTNVHEVVDIPNSPEKYYLVCGNYEYYHYLCDGFDDRTICSWMSHNYKVSAVPSIREIQEVLVQLDDKPKSFLDSRQWIGSFEVCLVIDKLYDIPCKILHVNKGNELNSIVDALMTHFEQFSSPVMMGGDVDCSSKGVMGMRVDGNCASLLIVDPHYVGKEHTKEFLYNKGWIKWQPMNDFLTSSFYNLCLPQVKAKSNR